MKKFTFKGVLENFKSSLTQPNRHVAEFEEEVLKKENFHFSYTIKQGFPHGATCLAYDPVQNLIAIGTSNGALRILGKPGVDIDIKHETLASVQQILFIINEGALISSCTDDTLHVWNLKQNPPTITHSLKFQRERITFVHLPFQSKWLFVGTQKGNIHIVNIDNLKLSGYVINWNKTIDIMSKLHPGAVVHISDNPIDPNKLLLGFETGSMVLWDLRNKSIDARFHHSVPLKSVSWHYDGKSFMSSHIDGSLLTWYITNNNKLQNTKPFSISFPHARSSEKLDKCFPIDKVDWSVTKSGENLIIFSGGLTLNVPTITIMQGKSTTVLEMEHHIIDFFALAKSPFAAESTEPTAIAVLFTNDLVLIDLTSQGYPCFENPFALDLHENPITLIQYFADPPNPQLISQLYSVGMKQKKIGYSEKNWPLNGGELGKFTNSYQEIILTGHSDGTLKFWDASAMNLQILYRLKTNKIFERTLNSQIKDEKTPSQLVETNIPDTNTLPPPDVKELYISGSPTSAGGKSTLSSVNYTNSSSDSQQTTASNTQKPNNSFNNTAGGNINSNPKPNSQQSYVKTRVTLPITLVEFDMASSILAVAIGKKRYSFVNVYTFAKQDINKPIPMLRVGNPSFNPETDNTSNIEKEPTKIYVKPGNVKQSPGFQADFVICLEHAITLSKHSEHFSKPFESGGPPNNAMSPTASSSVTQDNHGLDQIGQITAAREGHKIIEPRRPISIKFQPSYGILAIGTTCGIFVIDYINMQPLINLNTQDLYGGNDPFNRISNKFMPLFRSKPTSLDELDRSKSPTTMEVNAACVSSTNYLDPNSSNTTISAQHQHSSGLYGHVHTENNMDPEDFPANTVNTTTTTQLITSQLGGVRDTPLTINNLQSPLGSPIRGGGETTSTAQNNLLPSQAHHTQTGTMADTEDAGGNKKEWITVINISLDPNNRTTMGNNSTNPQSVVTQTQVPTMTGMSNGPPSAFSGTNTYNNVTQSGSNVSQNPTDYYHGTKDGADTTGYEETSTRQNTIDSDEFFENNLPHLWIGTSFGSIIVLEFPPPKRRTHNVKITPTGTIFRIKGKVLCIDYIGNLPLTTVVSSTTPVVSGKSLAFRFKKQSNLNQASLSTTSSIDSISQTMENMGGGGSHASPIPPPITFSTGSGEVTSSQTAQPNLSNITNRGTYNTEINSSNVNSSAEPITPAPIYGKGGGLSAYASQHSLESRQSGNSPIPPPLTSSTQPTNVGTDKQQQEGSTSNHYKEYAILVSQFQACAVSLRPATYMSAIYKVKIANEHRKVLVAQIIDFNNQECLTCYASNGHILIYSVPSFRLLFDTFVESPNIIRMSSHPHEMTNTNNLFRFGNNGNGIYLCSPSEIQKFTFSADMCKHLPDMQCKIYKFMETPEPPKTSFFATLFSSRNTSIDREELFGEAGAGKAQRSAAVLLKDANLKAQATASGPVQKARLALGERGEKLGHLDERTAQMLAQSENYSKTAHDIMLKYKDKKWYQF